MADTVGKQRIRTDSNTDAVFRLADSAGSNVAAVDASGRQLVDIAAQTLAAVKISRDGNAPSASQGSYVEVTTANAVVAVTNPLHVRIGNGTAVNSATVPVFSQLTNGTAVNALSAPAFVQLSDGSAAFGTVGNPLNVSMGTSSPGTTVFRYNNATVTAGATTNIDYTVTALKTLTIQRITVSGPESGNYLLVIDPAGTPVNAFKAYTSPGSTQCRYEFARPLTVAAGLVVRVAKTNDSHQTAEMGFTWEGYEV